MVNPSFAVNPNAMWGDPEAYRPFQLKQAINDEYFDLQDQTRNVLVQRTFKRRSSNGSMVVVGHTVTSKTELSSGSQLLRSKKKDTAENNGYSNPHTMIMQETEEAINSISNEASPYIEIDRLSPASSNSDIEQYVDSNDTAPPLMASNGTSGEQVDVNRDTTSPFHDIFQLAQADLLTDEPEAAVNPFDDIFQQMQEELLDDEPGPSTIKRLPEQATGSINRFIRDAPAIPWRSSTFSPPMNPTHAYYQELQDFSPQPNSSYQHTQFGQGSPQPSTSYQRVQFGHGSHQPSSSYQNAQFGQGSHQPSSSYQRVQFGQGNSQPSTSYQNIPFGQGSHQPSSSYLQFGQGNSQPSTSYQNIPFGHGSHQPSSSYQSIPFGQGSHQPSSSYQRVQFGQGNSQPSTSYQNIPFGQGSSQPSTSYQNAQFGQGSSHQEQLFIQHNSPQDQQYEENDYEQEDDLQDENIPVEPLNEENIQEDEQGNGRKRTNNPEKTVIPYDYLVYLALLNSPTGQLTVTEMYPFIRRYFNCFDDRESWRSSLRHALNAKSNFFARVGECNGNVGIYKIRDDKINNLREKMRKIVNKNINNLEALRLTNINDLQYLLSGSAEFGPENFVVRRRPQRALIRQRYQQIPPSPYGRNDPQSFSSRLLARNHPVAQPSRMTNQISVRMNQKATQPKIAPSPYSRTDPQPLSNRLPASNNPVPQPSRMANQIYSSRNQNISQHKAHELQQKSLPQHNPSAILQGSSNMTEVTAPGPATMFENSLVRMTEAFEPLQIQEDQVQKNQENNNGLEDVMMNEEDFFENLDFDRMFD